MLEGSPVPLAHEELDQSLVGLVHLLFAASEADSRTVDDRKVVGHRVIETDEAMIEDLNQVVG